MKKSSHVDLPSASFGFSFLAIGQKLSFSLKFYQLGLYRNCSFWYDPYYYLMGIKNRPYFTTFSALKLNNSKTTHQILTNLTVLENIDKTTFVGHIADILRTPGRILRQPQ